MLVLLAAAVVGQGGCPLVSDSTCDPDTCQQLECTIFYQSCTPRPFNPDLLGELPDETDVWVLPADELSAHSDKLVFPPNVVQYDSNFLIGALTALSGV